MGLAKKVRAIIMLPLVIRLQLMRVQNVLKTSQWGRGGILDGDGEIRTGGRGATTDLRTRHLASTATADNRDPHL